ncbi:MAG: OprO/OprP family phosphate-selective porin [Pseudomonadota bacterium]|nr:OprO/OprP family phosphate-selective porin [Pseudomonadota bacterium]
MKLGDKNNALVAMVVVAFATHPGTARAEDVAAEIHLLKEQVKQLEPLKERLKQLEAEVAKEKRERKEARGGVRNAAPPPPHGMVCKDAPCPPPPPPVFVSFGKNFNNGPLVESWDHDFSFRVGGRLLLDGGVSSQPEKGFGSLASFNQARLLMEGKAFRYWDYRLEYDFAGNAPLTSPTGTSTTVAGGIRDAFLALSYFDPVTFQVGNFYEPVGLERTQSKLYIDFIERALVTEGLGPSRHIGFAAFTHGPDWTVKGGIFTTSVEDKAVAPLPGGHQYWEAAGRVTFAPIRSADTLLHLGGSVRYQRPNDATAVSDDRVLALGSNIRTEANVLSENLLGTPSLSCGATVVGENCAKNVLDYGAEFVGAYGPFSVQGEYIGAHYNRDPALIKFLKAPGGSALDFSGYYVYATWYLTGESRVASYRDDYRRPGTFGQIEINNPLSAGGTGAWEVGARFSELNLNDAGIQGGREQDLTVGLNWYPDIGIRFMANWIRVMQLAAPFDRPSLNGAHPNIFVMRTQVNW